MGLLYLLPLLTNQYILCAVLNLTSYRTNRSEAHNRACAMQYSASEKFQSGLQSISVTKDNVVKENNTFKDTDIAVAFHTRQQLIIYEVIKYFYFKFEKKENKQK